MNKTKKLISLILVAVLVVTSLTGCATTETASTPTWMPEKWDLSADVVVVGYGPAGAMAAKAAHEEGASTLIIEKESYEDSGGSAAVSMAYIFDFSPELLEHSSMGKVDSELAEIIVDESRKSMDWLKETGLEFQGIIAEGYGPGLYEAVRKGIDSLGLQIIYDTPAEELIFDPVTREVYGVKCTDKTGNVINVKANKGVVLATGGFVENEDLVDRFIMPKGTGMVSAGAPSQTGDGLLMALDAGAAIDGMTMFNMEWYGLAYKKASEEMDTAILHLINEGAIDARMFVNQDGNRFMDEETYIVHNKNQLPFLDYIGELNSGYPGWTNLPMYVIFDSSLADSAPVGPNNYSVGWASHKDIYDNWSVDNQVELEKGWLVSDDTLEGLVSKLAESSENPEINVENLQKSIEKYNSYCEQQNDADFERSPITLKPLNNPPYYAAQLVPSPVYTIGGLQGGDNGETLDWDGNPIPRLYHAGDISQPIDLRVLGINGVMGLGTLAGRAAAALESH